MVSLLVTIDVHRMQDEYGFDLQSSIVHPDRLKIKPIFTGCLKSVPLQQAIKTRVKCTKIFGELRCFNGCYSLYSTIFVFNLHSLIDSAVCCSLLNPVRLVSNDFLIEVSAIEEVCISFTREVFGKPPERIKASSENYT